MSAVGAFSRPLAIAALVAALGGFAGACAEGGQKTPPASSAPAQGTSQVPAPQSTSSASPGSQTEGPPRCQTATLQASLPSPPDVATGNVGHRLALTNTGTGPCTIAGYPGYGLLDQARRPLPTDVTRGTSFFTADPGPRPVILAPGQTAHAYFAFGQVPAGGTACEQASFIEITPPDETASVTVPFSGHVCGGGHLTTTALLASPPTVLR